MFKILAVTVLAITLIDAAHGQIPTQLEDRLVSVPAQASPAGFGTHVLLTDRWLFVNTPNDDTPTIGLGAVHVYERSSGELTLNSIVYPQGVDTTTLWSFGSGGLSVVGEQLAVATQIYSFDLNAQPVLEGRVHLYLYNGTQWVLDQVVTAPDYPTMAMGNGFGASAAFASSDELLVGANGDEPTNVSSLTNTGSVYVYRRDTSGVWQFDQKVFGPLPPNRIAGFGLQLRANGDQAIVHGSNKAYEIVKQPNGTWTLGNFFDFPEVGVRIYGGFDYNDEWLITGNTQGQCEFEGLRSRAYVYRKTGGVWSLFQVLFPDDSYRGPIGSCQYGRDLFGSSIDLEGDRVAIGSPFMPVGGGVDGGQASIFEFQGQEWVETRKLEMVSPQQTGFLGGSVSLEGDSVALGAFAYQPHAAGSSQSGAVAFYDLPRGDQVCDGVPNSTGSPATLNVYGNEVAERLDVYADVTGLPPGVFCLGLVGEQPGFVLNPGGSIGNLCLSGTIGRFLGQVAASDSVGVFSWRVQDQGLPIPTGFVAIQAGSSWVFQAWYRDQQSGLATSNFSSAVRASFR